MRALRSIKGCRKWLPQELLATRINRRRVNRSRIAKALIAAGAARSKRFPRIHQKACTQKARKRSLASWRLRKSARRDWVRLFAWCSSTSTEREKVCRPAARMSWRRPSISYRKNVIRQQRGVGATFVSRADAAIQPDRRSLLFCQLALQICQEFDQVAQLALGHMLD